MLRDQIQRALAPRAVVALSRLRIPRPWSRIPRVELYFAFDDPYAAIGLPGLLELTKDRGLELEIYPLLERGVPNDPAAEKRLLYSIVDADRLARRSGRRVSRSLPLSAADCAFLADWTEAARGDAAAALFAASALDELWLRSDGAVALEPYAELHRRVLGRTPRIDEAAARASLAQNAERLRARGHWESPATRVDGEWFFAHERLPQIAARLDQKLGRAR